MQSAKSLTYLITRIMTPLFFNNFNRLEQKPNVYAFRHDPNITFRFDANVEKILLMKHRGLGDTVLLTSTIEALSHWKPDHAIHLAIPSPYQSLFTHDKRIQKIIPLQPDRKKLHLDRTSLKQHSYRWALNFHASERSRKVIRATTSEVKLIHHHSRKGLPFGSDQRIHSLGKPMAAQERDLNVLRTLGWEGVTPLTSIQLETGAKERGAKRLESAGYPTESPPILIAPAATRAAKQWPLETYLSLIKRLSTEFPVAVIWDGNVFHPYQEYWFKKISSYGAIIQTPTLNELGDLLCAGRAWIGTDSGVKHLAAALSLPTVTLFGPESVGEWHGYPEHTHGALRVAVSCRHQNPEAPKFAWCAEAICPYADHPCLRDITPQEVLGKLHEVLDSK